jgi:adenylosuccinate synthase
VAELDRCLPIYETFPGWSEPIDTCRTFSDLPSEARRYVKAIEEGCGAPAGLVSVGPAPEETIIRL